MIDCITIFIAGDSGRAWKRKGKNIVSLDTHSYIGSYHNFTIREGLDGVRISGSIAKFIQGENVTAITRQKFVKGLDTLAAGLGIDLHNAIVTQAELGASFIVKEVPCSYLALFGSMKRKKQVSYRGIDNQLENITYCTKTGAIKFLIYDKAREIKDNKDKMPYYCEGRNLLRLELKINNRTGVKKLLGGGKDITSYDLTSRTIYCKFKKLFSMLYNNIEKRQQIVLLDIYGKNNYTVKTLIEMLAIVYYQSNYNKVDAFIADLKTAGKLSDTNAKRFRRFMRETNKNTNLKMKNMLIDGLDRVIHRQIKKG